MRVIVLLMIIIVFAAGCTKILSKKNREKTTPIPKVRNDDMLAVKIDELLIKKSFNGSVLVVRDGKTIIEKGYGYADYSGKIKNTPGTKFQIGSITKQFTAACILKLVDEGKIGLEDSITKYLDYPEWQEVKISNLLSHSSGIKTCTTEEIFNSLDVSKEYQPVEIVKMIENNKLNFKPGEGFEYSNTNYVLLGMIIEKISGLSYNDFLKKNIFEKVGMNDSGIKNDYYSGLDNIAYGYENNKKYNNAKRINMTFPYAAGAIYSTVGDLYKWDRALYGEEIVSKTSKEKMFSQQNKHYIYGYGWMIEKNNSIVRHGGTIFGFQSQFYRDITGNTLIVILSNCDNTDSDYLRDRMLLLMKSN